MWLYINVLLLIIIIKVKSVTTSSGLPYKYTRMLHRHFLARFDKVELTWGVSSGESKDLRVAERGQLAKVYLRRTEGQALCLQLAAEKPVHMPEWRKISRPLLLKLFWHVVAREMGGGRWPCHRLPLLHLISQTGPLFFSAADVYQHPGHIHMRIWPDTFCRT